VQEGPQPFHDRTTLKNFLSLARHYRNNTKSFGGALLWSGVIAEYEKALGMDISPSGIRERHTGGATRELPIGKIVRGKVGSKKTRGHNPALYGTGRRRLAPNPELLLIGNPHEGCGNPSCKVCRHTRRSNGMKRHRSRNSRRRSRNYPLYVRYGGKKIRRAAALKKLQFRFKKSGKARTLKSAYRMAKGAVNRLHTYHGKKQRVRLGGGRRVTKAMRAAGKRLGRMSRKVAKMVKSGKYTRKQAFKKLAKKK
jgi:hypothetical protein